jgi:hypothetical protein
MICKLQPAAQRHHDNPSASPTLGLIKEFQLVSKDFKTNQSKSKQIKAEKLWRLIQLPLPLGPIRAMLTPLSRLFAFIRTYSHLFAVDF